MSNDELEKLAEKYVKSSAHKSDPYCELGYYHPMRKGFKAGYTARDSEVKALVDTLQWCKKYLMQVTLEKNLELYTPEDKVNQALAAYSVKETIRCQE